MAIRNNAPSHDDDATRSDRTLLLQTNVDTYSSELGIAGALLTWAQGCHTGWQDAMAAATGESGQTEEASQEYRLKYDECHNYYQRAKNMLLSIIYQYQKPDEIVEAYEIGGRSPRSRGDLETAIDNIVRQHDIFIAAADLRVLPQPIVDQMVVLKDEIAVKWSFVKQERIESRDAYDDKQDYFDDDSLKLRLIYDMACMIWGPDENRLINLGFLPRSMVWTEDKPPHPAEFEWNNTANEFQWLPVADVDEYEIDYRLTGASGDWTQLYKGADTSTPKKPPDPGEYDFRIRSWAEDDSGAWSGVIVVNFSGGALAAPIGFKFDDVKQLFSWIKVKYADSYQFEYSRDGGQTWIMKYEGADAKFDATDMDPGKALFRVRALNATETSPWGITLDVWLGVPAIPKNLRWHPEEYHGDMFAKIEWDAAAGADEYELENITEGFVFNTGASTFKFEDIIDLPGEHEYKVRAGNAYGWSEWSPVLTFWLGVPEAPLNLGWRYIEYLGEQWWEIFWDSAGGAVNYDLSYINAGHQDYYGPNTRSGPIDPKPEPGEHRFKVRGENDYGFGEWSEILTIVVE